MSGMKQVGRNASAASWALVVLVLMFVAGWVVVNSSAMHSQLSPMVAISGEEQRESIGDAAAQPAQAAVASDTVDQGWSVGSVDSLSHCGTTSAFSADREVVRHMVVRYAFKRGRLSWYEFEYPGSWHIRWRNEGKIVEVTDRSQEDIRQLYGRPHGVNYAFVQMRLSRDDYAPIESLPISSLEPGFVAVGPPVFCELNGQAAAEFRVTYSRGLPLTLLRTRVANGILLSAESRVIGEQTDLANQLRVTLESIVGSIRVIPDYVAGVMWQTPVPVSLGPDGGTVIVSVPDDWELAGREGGVELTSSALGAYAEGASTIVIAEGVAGDAEAWESAMEVPYRILGLEARSPDPPGYLASDHTYLVQPPNGVMARVHVKLPSSLERGSESYWFYDQVVWSVLQRSAIQVPPQAYP